MTIPIDALTHHIAILGKTGAGKTYTAKGAAEALMEAGRRVCVIDPTGAWWGLRLAADGKASGFPVVIFGGQHADVPLTEGAGAKLAEVIAAGGFSSVIDTSDMTVGARTRLFTDFAEAMFRANRRPLHLIVDEAHVFAPQGRVSDPMSGRMVHATNNLVSGGRSRALRIMLLTQRPAKLHKDSLTQVETLIAMRLIAPQDRAAVEAWIGEWADPKEGKAIVASLPSLERGEGWIWAPELGLLERRCFPTISTFDSSRTPEDGEAVQTPDLGSIDLAGITASLAEPEPDAPPTRTARAPDKAALEREYQRGLAEGITRGEAAGIAIGITRAQQALAGLRVDGPAPVATPITPSPNPKPSTAAPKAATSSDGSLSGPQRQMLASIAWWVAMGHPQPSKAQVAAVAGWKITSGHLKNVAGGLRTAGLIDYPVAGHFALTKAGEAAAPAPDMTADFHDRLRSTLSGPQRSAFDALLQTGGPASRENLAAACGWEPTSGHVKNVLGSMRTLEIIDYPAPGMVDLQPWVRA